MEATGGMKKFHQYLRLFNLGNAPSLNELKKAYHKSVREWHPDRFPDNDGMRTLAEERIKEINIAYNVLLKWVSGRNDNESDESQAEELSWIELDKDNAVVNLSKEILFPIIYRTLFDFKFSEIAWNTIQKSLKACLVPTKSNPRHLDISISLHDHGDRTKIKFDTAFAHKSDNLKLGFVEIPSISQAIKAALVASDLSKDGRDILTKSYFSDFQLHEITWSEIKRKSVFVTSDEKSVELQGITINQLLNLVYKALGKCNASAIHWNTYNKTVYGTTGWSLRSCGQFLKAEAGETLKGFRVTFSSLPISSRGLSSTFDDLGRGREEVKKLMNEMLDQLCFQG